MCYNKKNGYGVNDCRISFISRVSESNTFTTRNEVDLK